MGEILNSVLGIIVAVIFIDVMMFATARVGIIAEIVRRHVLKEDDEEE